MPWSGRRDRMLKYTEPDLRICSFPCFALYLQQHAEILTGCFPGSIELNGSFALNYAGIRILIHHLNIPDLTLSTK